MITESTEFPYTVQLTTKANWGVVFLHPVFCDTRRAIRRSAYTHTHMAHGYFPLSACLWVLGEPAEMLTFPSVGTIDSFVYRGRCLPFLYLGQPLSLFPFISLHFLVFFLRNGWLAACESHDYKQT